MEFVVIGINHKTAPIEIREKFFCSPAQQELALSELRNNPKIVDGLVLSTCNRTEIYCHMLDHSLNPDTLVNLLFETKKLKPTEKLKQHFYAYSGEVAVRHFLKVTTGLDSLILGEKQILGQVKGAVDLARKKAMLGKNLNILSNIAIRTGKKAQNETEISSGGCSLSWAAVVTAEKIFGSLSGKSVLIMGAGKMSALALTQLRNKGVSNIFVMNRTQTCAEALAQRCQGEAVSFGDIKEILNKIDVCICSVGAPHYILEKSTVEKVMGVRPGQKLVFIDISMPRNIDPQIATVDNVRLFYIDDLDKIVGDSMRKREAAVAQVEKIVEMKTAEFYRKISLLQQMPSSDYFEAKIRK